MKKKWFRKAAFWFKTTVLSKQQEGKLVFELFEGVKKEEESLVGSDIPANVLNLSIK